MIHQPAEERFLQARTTLARGRTRQAMAEFKEAIELERTYRGDGRCEQGRYWSFYGLCLWATRTSARDALLACRTGAELDPGEPDAWWNLGRVALSLNRRGEAYRAWNRGLRLAPGHDGMRRGLERLGMRRSPVLTWLPREHPWNVALGIARTRLRTPVRVFARRRKSEALAP